MQSSVITDAKCKKDLASRHLLSGNLFSDTNFSQVLEGPRAEVERLYETFNHDPRHKDLLLLLSEPLAARQFPDWSMAYIGPNQWAKQAAGTA